jgi:hypothetical protein
MVGWLDKNLIPHTILILFKAATVPEFPSIILLGLIIIPTFAGALIYKKRHS